MIEAPNQPRRPLKAFSLASLYAIASGIPTAFCLWFASSNLLAAPAMSQVLRVPPLDEAPNSHPTDRPTTRELLEEARQRLIERGELPAQPSPPAPASLPSPIPTEAPPLPVPNATAPDIPFDTYRLGPGDGLFVNVLRFPELSFQGTIDLQGNLVVPLVGVLTLRGLTIEQARELIQSELDRYVVSPQVSLTLVAQRPVQVTVLGEVVRPGLYPLPAPQVSVALVSAGGTTSLANLRDVLVRRTLADGSTIERNVDLFTPLQTSAALPDVRLEDGDTIVVPELTAETVGDYNSALVARSTLAQPQINIRFLNYSAAGGRGGSTGALGSIVLPNGSTFLDALTTIAPSPSTADLRNIALIRFDPSQGKAISQELNGRNALRGDATQNPALQNNDVIIIGRNFINRITYALNTFTQPFRDILGFLLFFNTITDTADELFGPTGGDNNDDNDN